MYSRTWENADGTYTAEIATRPMHYPAADGSLQPVSTALTSTTRAGYAAANETNTLRTYLPGNAAGWVRVESDDAAVSFRPIGAATSPVSLAASRAVFASVAPSVSLAYDVEPGRLKETITLSAPVALATFAFALRPEGLSPKANKDGSVTLLRRGGDEALTIEAPWMQDAKGNVSHAIAVSLVPAAGDYVYTLVPDKEWLAKAAYPVIVDPSVSWKNLGANWSAVARQAYPNTQYSPGLEYYGYSVGNYPVIGARAPSASERIVLHYNSVLPLDSDILGATVSFTIDHGFNYGADSAIQAYGLPKELVKDGTDLKKPTWTNVVTNGGAPGPATAVLPILGDYAPGTPFTFDVVEIVRGWDDRRDDDIAVPSSQNIVLRDVSDDSGTPSGIRFASSQQVYLSVTYVEGWYTLQGNRRRQGRTQYAVSANAVEQWDTALDDTLGQPDYFDIHPGLVAVPDFQNRSSGRPALYAVVSNSASQNRIYRIRDNGTSVEKSSVLLDGVTLTGTPLVLGGPTSTSDSVYVVGTSGGVGHLYRYDVTVSGGQVVWTQAKHYSFDGDVPSSPAYYPRTVTYALRKANGELVEATSTGAIIVTANIANKGYLLAFSPQTLRPVWGRVRESDWTLETVSCQHNIAEPGGLCRLGTFATLPVLACESSPCIDGDSVYAQDTSCYLNVRSAASGDWEAPGELMPTPNGAHGTVSALGGRVYYGDLGGRIVATETNPFELLWDRPATALGDPYSLDSIMTTGAFSAENDTVLYGNDAGQLLAAGTDYDSGIPTEPLLWGLELLAPEPQIPIRCSPIIAGAPGSASSLAFVGADDARVHLVDPASGVHLSDLPTGGGQMTGGIVRGGMAAYRGRLYVLTAGRDPDLTPTGTARLHCYY